MMKDKESSPQAFVLTTTDTKHHLIIIELLAKEPF